MAAANALRYLKAGDENQYTEDCFIWYALAERLHRKHGYYTGWMLHHAVPRCPHCGSECKFVGAVWHKEAVCASQPGPTNEGLIDELRELGYQPGHGNVDASIREKVCSIYNRAFVSDEGDEIDTLRFR